jgi:phage repressor protein C with HTH and peptisase S24 domain
MIIDRIMQLIKYKGINKRKFYIETGLSNGFLDKVKDIGASKIEQILITYPEVNPEWLLTGKGEMIDQTFFSEDSTIDRTEEPTAVYHSFNKIKKQSVPVYDVQNASEILSLFKDSRLQAKDYISVPNLPKCDGGIEVNSDSMYPILKNGDTVLYKKMENLIDVIFWGEMYLIAFSTDDSEDFFMIKWIQKSDKGNDWIKLVSENSHYEPKDIHFKNIKGLALIRASIRVISTY